MGSPDWMTDEEVREDWAAIDELVPDYQMQHASGETEEASLVERVQYLVMDARRYQAQLEKLQAKQSPAGQGESDG